MEGWILLELGDSHEMNENVWVVKKNGMSAVLAD